MGPWDSRAWTTSNSFLHLLQPHQNHSPFAQPHEAQGLQEGGKEAAESGPLPAPARAGQSGLAGTGLVWNSLNTEGPLG